MAKYHIWCKSSADFYFYYSIWFSFLISDDGKYLILHVDLMQEKKIYLLEKWQTSKKSERVYGIENRKVSWKWNESTATIKNAVHFEFNSY